MGAVLLMVSLHFFKALALFECVLVNVVLLFGGFDDIGQWQNKMIVTLMAGLIDGGDAVFYQFITV